MKTSLDDELDRYLKDGTLLEIQFGFTHFAAENLPKDKIDEYFAQALEANISSLGPIAERCPEGTRWFCQNELREPRSSYVEFLDNTMRVAELLLRVARFETMMKSIARYVFERQPDILHKLLNDPDVHVKKSKRYKNHPDLSRLPEKERDELINSAVRATDEGDIDRKHALFKKHFRIGWGRTLEEVEFLDAEILKVRNIISHDNPITEFVPEDHLRKATRLLAIIPVNCVKECKCLYK